MSQEGADTKVLGQLFKAVLQVMFIFRVETWVPNPLMERSLGIFQSRVARRLTGRHLWRQGDGSWDYPTMAAAIAEAVFEEIGVYVTRRKNTVEKYIATRPILDLYERSVRRPGAWVFWRWWE